jgi:hypothetical protein
LEHELYVCELCLENRIRHARASLRPPAVRSKRLRCFGRRERIESTRQLVFSNFIESGTGYMQALSH